MDNSHKKKQRVIAIVLDAADPELIETWMEDGSLPNLKALRNRGAYGRLDSVAEHLAEAVPYSFFSGKSPAVHGAMGFATWQAETMRFVPPGDEWLPITPFWRAFPADGPRTIALDVSNVYPPTPFNGIEIVGWASHDALVPSTTYPPEFADSIMTKHGSAHLSDEFYGLVTKKDFLATQDLTLKLSRKFRDLCVDLITNETWDFFLAYTFALHHGGHRLYNTMNVTDSLTSEEKSEMDGTLRKVYMEADRAVSEILKVVDPETHVLVMSMHGMGINRSRTWILPQMLELILKNGDAHSLTASFLRRLRTLIPLRWRHAIKLRMPFSVRRGLTRFWRSGYDWERTRAFALISDTLGWVRVNLKGREARGIVPPEEYDSLLEAIASGLKSFVDEDSSEPVVKKVVRPKDVFDGEKLHRLPDLIIHWADSPSHLHRAVVSPQFGRIAWPTPGQNPEGRSGNHNSQGFLFACGPGIGQGKISDAHILDLPPTILHFLGQPIPQEMEGKVISFPSPEQNS